jgi:serine/threonine-protein kinase HipA
MSRTLDVYLRRHLVGQLIQDENGQLAYYYAESWLNHAKAQCRCPIRCRSEKEKFNRNECRGFFAGVLPDESKREIIAKNLGISARNDFAMLEQIGGECAGAVTFIPAGEKLPERKLQLPPVDRRKTGGNSQNAAAPSADGGRGRHPAFVGWCAGQNCRACRHNQISIPLGGAPSTHILKPAIERFEGIVFNEAFCMKLAHAHWSAHGQSRSGQGGGH